jgi:hypothetical protein
VSFSCAHWAWTDLPENISKNQSVKFLAFEKGLLESVWVRVHLHFTMVFIMCLAVDAWARPSKGFLQPLTTYPQKNMV